MGNVKLFRSSDYGAPTMYGNAGFMIAVLEACLVNGYGQTTLATLTHSNGVVTATTSAPHGFGQYSRQTIAGANEAGYNGEFLITVTDAYTFTYLASGISVTPATGTITSKAAGAGWTKPYVATNSAVFLQGGSNPKYLQVGDNVTLSSRVVGYETMTSYSSGTNAFPSAAQMSGGLYWNKSGSADATNLRDWILVGDDRTFYLWVRVGGDWSYGSLYSYGFGDYLSYKPGDASNQMIIGDIGSISYSQSYFTLLNTTFSSVTTATAQGFFGCKSYAQIGGSVALGRIADYSKSAQAYMGVGGLVFPNPADGGFFMSPVYVVEGAAVGAASTVRGQMRGIWCPLHNLPLNHGDTFLGNGDLAGKRFIAINSVSSTATGQFMIDLSMTW